MHVAKSLLTHELVAIKMVRLNMGPQEIELQSRKLKDCISSYIVRYYTAFENKGEVWVGFG